MPVDHVAMQIEDQRDLQWNTQLHGHRTTIGYLTKSASKNINQIR